jgi:predicted O-methyltransferase YrrM
VRQQLALLASFDLTPPAGPRWTPDNGMYDASDAAVLHNMLATFRPQRMVEVGSGFSTAVALDLAATSLPELTLTCVEPYPDRLKSIMRPEDADRLELIERPVQDIPPEQLAAMVGAGDVFFIDSTHVVKPGSDVVWLLLHTLPLLPTGVIVHIHDIFWPFEYPDDWLKMGRNWTEAYLLQAFLTNNADWEVLFFSSYLWSEHISLIPPELRALGPGSIWLRRHAC